MTDPQQKYYDDQDLLEVDIDNLYKKFIVPIDRRFRSHFNAIVSNSQELNTPDYQESRCHAFFRMMGFPVVSKSSEKFYSPGFDPNLNTDQISSKNYSDIAASIVSNSEFRTKQLDPRELSIEKKYRTYFANGDTNSIALAIGSIFLRSFDKQFSDDDSIGPLDFDSNQTQVVDARVSEINRFFQNKLDSINTKSLTSIHLIKPFIVDPRIDNNIHPASCRVCAPFLFDKTQLKIYDTQNSGTLKRPFIEEVISVRFNSKNVTQAQGAYVQSIIDFIKSNSSVTDSDLVDISNNQLQTLYQSELIIFNKYIKIIRALIKKLHESITKVGYIRQNINWQPIPNTKLGPEAGSDGGKIVSPPDPTDDLNNKLTENNIIDLINKKNLAEISFNIGIDAVPDSGDFAFSNIDDIIFSGFKNVKLSYDKQLTKLNSIRNQRGNEGLDHLKNIEIIVGEFSGLGLLDIMAIQAALWITDSNALLGLIDDRARQRAISRKDLNFNAAAPLDIIPSMTEFEKKVKQIYKIMGKYISDLNSGDATTNR